jgi:hypothetical protein
LAINFPFLAPTSIKEDLAMSKSSGRISGKMVVYLLTFALVSVIGAGARSTLASFISLNQALDNDHVTFRTNGAANWFGEDTTWYYGGSAARSGVVGDNQDSNLMTTVVGPGTLSFCWKVSSEPVFDFLHFGVIGTDGSDIYGQSISGEVDWRQVFVIIPSGTYVIKWNYSKDISRSSGQDCGWVDKVVWTGKAVRGVTPIIDLLLLQ